MSHCFSVTVEIEGRTQTICTIIPGNEGLRRAVEQAERDGTTPRAPTATEVRRAMDYFTAFPEGQQPRPGVHQRMHPPESP